MASIPTLPDEIMVEILLKLPVKSILRCSSLSKHYYSLIGSQYFIRRHLNANLYDLAITSPMLGSLSLFDCRGHFTVLEGLPPSFECSPSCRNPEIFGPVNGLYCVIYAKDKRVAVWNPSTREIFNVPYVHELNEVLEKEVRVYDGEYCLAYGFGYDDTTNDYKLVFIFDLMEDIIIHNTDERSLVATFYTVNISKGGEWSIPEQRVCFEAWEIITDFGVFTCGALHWIYTSYNISDYSIIAFDMSTEMHRIIAFPTAVDEYCVERIVTFNGFLGLVMAEKVENSERKSKSFDVWDLWVMKEYNVTESWTILHRVSKKPGMVSQVPTLPRFVGQLFGIVRNRIYVSEGDGWMVSYDLDSQDEERYDISDRKVESILPYEESLVRIIKSV